MGRADPWIVARNHRMQEAPEAASDRQDVAPFERLPDAPRHPLDVDARNAMHADPAARDVTAGHRTFCGTWNRAGRSPGARQSRTMVVSDPTFCGDATCCTGPACAPSRWPGDPLAGIPSGRVPHGEAPVCAKISRPREGSTW